MAEKSNDLQKFQIYQEPINVDTKCVEKCASNFDKLDISVDNVRFNELSLVDLNGEESIWLAEGISTNEGTENEWLGGELNLTGVTVEKNTLIDKLDNLARKSESHLEHSPRSPSNDINERSLISPPILPSDYLISQPLSSTPAARSPGSKLSKVKMSSPKLQAEGNATIITSDQPLNSTFDKESANCTFNQEALPPKSTGLNATFSNDEVQDLNSTFSKEGNATFNQTGNMNATFDLSKEKNNSSIETPERIEEMTSDVNKESELKARSPINCDEALKNLDSLNNSNGRKSPSFPASPSSEHGSDIHVSRLGGASIKPPISRNRLPPPSRLQAPPRMRYQVPQRSKGAPSTPSIPQGIPGPPSNPFIPRGTTTASAIGKVRSCLRPPMSIPQNVLKPPTSRMRPPAQVPGKTLRQQTIPQANLQKPLKTGTNLRLPSISRPPASMIESGLRKPSGIVRPSAVAAVARPTGSSAVVARPSGSSAVVARPSGSSAVVARPSGSSAVANSSRSSEVARPSGSSAVARPSGSSAVAWPSGLARPAAGVRQGITKQIASSDNHAPHRNG